METMATKHPFEHVMEAHRPQPTGKTARHNAPIYHNPGCNPPEDCAMDSRTGFLYTLSAWEKVCDERERDAAPLMLAALQDLRKELRAHFKLDVKKHYSLMVADAAAGTAIHKATT